MSGQPPPPPPPPSPQPPPPIPSRPAAVRNVVLVTLDGVRTQEVFGGIDTDIIAHQLLPAPHAAASSLERSPIYQAYGAATAEERRLKLWPWLWGTFLPKHGFALGNRGAGSVARVRNRWRFSYPGYAEMLCGLARDDAIDSNELGPCPHPTVLEFLQRRLQLGRHEVAAFASWQCLANVCENTPGSFTVNAGRSVYVPPPLLPSAPPASDGPTKVEHQQHQHQQHQQHQQQALEDAVAAARLAELNRLQFLTSLPFPDLRHDVFTFELAMYHARRYKPRVLYIGLGETDDWAHERSYGLYCENIRRADTFLGELWYFIQTDPFYKDQTALLITTDHGRGDTLADWTDHGKVTPGAEFVWFACHSPSSARNGIVGDLATTRSDVRNTVYQTAQLAATFCRLLGIEPHEYDPDVASPLPFVV